MECGLGDGIHEGQRSNDSTPWVGGLGRLGVAWTWLVSLTTLSEGLGMRDSGDSGGGVGEITCAIGWGDCVGMRDG